MSNPITSLFMGDGQVLKKAVVPTNLDQTFQLILQEVCVDSVSFAEINVNPRSVATGIDADSFAFMYYYRIVVTPETMTLRNPRVGVPVNFYIWNAYPYANTLTTITTVDAEGLSLDISPPSAFFEIEYREIGLTINPSAPPTVVAQFDFDFTYGSGTLYFNAILATLLFSLPDPPITEELEWLTDVIRARDGKEQRISLRSAPRRKVEYNFILENNEEIRTQLHTLYTTSQTRVVVPWWPYYTRTTQPVSISDTTVYLDTARTDLKVGEYMFLYDPVSQSTELSKLATVLSDRVTVEDPLQNQYSIGAAVAPGFICRYDQKPGYSLHPVQAAQAKLKFLSLEPRQEFRRTGSSTVFVEHDGYKVLDRRPLANEKPLVGFDSGVEIQDRSTGIVDIFSPWLHPAIELPRDWLIARVNEPTQMDWWRDFLDEVAGQQVPFLMPTWQPDLAVHTPPTTGGTQITLMGDTYATMWAAYDGTKRLALRTPLGWHYATPVSVSGATGNSVVEFLPPMPTDPLWLQVEFVSILLLVRLGADTVTIEHDTLESVISVPMRTVDG